MSIDPEAEMIAMQNMGEEGNKSGSDTEVDAALAWVSDEHHMDGQPGNYGLLTQ